MIGEVERRTDTDTVATVELEPERADELVPL